MTLSAIWFLGYQGIIPLDNVGRCDHTYAHWLAEQGHRIPPDRQPNDLILFLKDNNNRYRSGAAEMLKRNCRIFGYGRAVSSTALVKRNHGSPHRANATPELHSISLSLPLSLSLSLSPCFSLSLSIPPEPKP